MSEVPLHGAGAEHHQPSECQKILFIGTLAVSLVSGDLQYRSRGLDTAIFPHSDGVKLEDCLTQCIHLLVLESQLPHKTVNSIFPLAIVNNKVTIFWGS